MGQSSPLCDRLYSLIAKLNACFGATYAYQDSSKVLRQYAIIIVIRFCFYLHFTQRPNISGNSLVVEADLADVYLQLSYSCHASCVLACVVGLRLPALSPQQFVSLSVVCIS